MSSHFALARMFEFEERKNWWHKSPMKNEKVAFSMFFHQQMIFLHKSKVDGLKKLDFKSGVHFAHLFVLVDANF